MAEIHPEAIVENSYLGEYSRVKKHAELRNVYLDDYSYVSQGSMVVGTVIGKFVSVGPGCFIGLWEHDDQVSTHTFYLYETSGNFVRGYKNFKKDGIQTTIGSDVWIGAGAIVKKGVQISTGAIVGAGAVVTKDVEPYSIVVGHPAKKIRLRFSEEIIKSMLNSEWWNMPREDLQEMVNLELFSDLNKFLNYISAKNGIR